MIMGDLFPYQFKSKRAPESSKSQGIYSIVIVWLEVGRLVSFWGGFLTGAFAVKLSGERKWEVAKSSWCFSKGAK